MYWSQRVGHGCLALGYQLVVDGLRASEGLFVTRGQNLGRDIVDSAPKVLVKEKMTPSRRKKTARLSK